MKRALTLALCVALSGCEPAMLTPPEQMGVAVGGGELPPLVLELLHSGLTSPVELQVPNDGTNRLFIVEQTGRIRISENANLQSAAEAFLNVSALVAIDHNEQGLLGIAFHPDFVDNGRFFVSYTEAGTGDAVFAEYAVSDDPNSADADSARIFLRLEQVGRNHNGGQLRFGPGGMLYIGTGDGGGRCGGNDRAQDGQTLLGKILRLDMDNPPSFVPADNPFVDDESARDEIWARGLRNPWRFSFDPLNDDLYIGDVGDLSREEIDIVNFDLNDPPNFGWSVFEGTLSPPFLCSPSSFDGGGSVMPAVEYMRSDGCAVIGGYVYRGSAIPELDGVYFYSDHCTAFVRAVRFEDGEIVAATDLTDSLAQEGGSLDNPTSFGIDAEGELYVLDRDGDIFRLIADD